LVRPESGSWGSLKIQEGIWNPVVRKRHLTFEKNICLFIEYLKKIRAFHYRHPIW
jgi:hypothetical protein